MEMQNDMPVKQGKKRGEKKLVKPIAKKKKKKVFPLDYWLDKA